MTDVWSVPNRWLANVSDVTVGTAIVMIHQLLARRVRRQHEPGFAPRVAPATPRR